MWQRIMQVTVFAAVLVLSACGGGSDGLTPQTAQQLAREAPCSTVGQNVFVKDTMDDWYLWFQEIPDVNPANFASPEALLERIRFKRFDETFSFITTVEAEQQLLGESRFIGFGFGLILLPGPDLRITEVFPNSPAEEAGFARGLRILSIDGQSVETLAANGLIDEAIGPNVAGLTVVFELRALDGTEFTAAPTKREVSIPPVPLAKVIDVNGVQVGYLLMKNFTEPSFAALDEAFVKFTDAGVTEVILDLRYNGGGLIAVANFLANLLGGAVPEGELFTRFQFNRKHRDQDFEFLFAAQANSLPLTRLVVIATRSTASASEEVINGMDPFVPVTLVGDRTFGKPVGQNGFEFCEKILRPVTFRSVNAAGNTDYFNGLPVDCIAEDDLSNALGDIAENSLAEALTVIDTGGCSVTAQKQKQLRAEKPIVELPQPVHANGERLRLGAY